MKKLIRGAHLYPPQMILPQLVIRHVQELIIGLIYLQDDLAIKEFPFVEMDDLSNDRSPNFPHEEELNGS